MYEIGDLIIHGSTGVCRVTDISRYDMRGLDSNQLYYVLDSLYQKYTIYVPVNSDKVFMRLVISKDEAEKMIDKIPTIIAKSVNNRAMRELEESYESFFRTHDCADLITLTMSIYAKKQEAELQKRKFGAVDERFMKQAEELLYGELAVALDIPKESVREYIDKRVGSEQKELQSV
jgi:CarD family transcriptional regulator